MDFELEFLIFLTLFHWIWKGAVEGGELGWCKGGPKSTTNFTCTQFDRVHLINKQVGSKVKPVYRPCDFLVLGPHCCSDFCIPGIGECDWKDTKPMAEASSGTGSCFCDGEGAPTGCSIYNREMPKKDWGPFTAEDFEECGLTCDLNQPCVLPALVYDSIHKICICYCPEKEPLKQTKKQTFKN